MANSCFSCGESFTNDVNALLRAFKKQYEQKGIVRYYYRLSPTDTIKICKANSFNTIFENEINPNLSQGAEFAHIVEYQ